MTMIPINAVVTVDCAEGNESIGTEWTKTFIVPLDMTLREAVKQMFGEPFNWPRGRVCLTIPETLPPVQPAT